MKDPIDDQSGETNRLPAQWPYSAELPQRYAHNYERYLSLGGLVNLASDVSAFVSQEKGQRGDMARFYAFCLILDQLTKQGLRGDLAELGVYKDSTAVLLARIARRLGKTAYLLDTYEGFNAADFQGVDARQDMSFTDTSPEAVRALVGDANVQYVKGYFPDSAAQLPSDGRYCLVHIDCDLYAPMLSALGYFYPRLVPGGFLIMHDYSSLHWGGAEKAVDEFFADKPESVVPMPDNAGSVIVRKSKIPDRYGNWFVERKHAILTSGWLAAGHDGLREFLGNGWSSPEHCGYWGLGSALSALAAGEGSRAGSRGRRGIVGRADRAAGRCRCAGACARHLAFFDVGKPVGSGGDDPGAARSRRGIVGPTSGCDSRVPSALLGGAM